MGVGSGRKMTDELILVGVATLAIAICVTCARPQADEARVSVMVGGELHLDACGAVGVVSGLKPRPGNTLSVRSGPGHNYSRIDGLASGTRVWLCDRNGDWLGVIYDLAGSGCGVSTPSKRRAYEGPCSSGWVHAKYVELTAG
jgi:hypothetical protein